MLIKAYFRRLVHSTSELPRLNTAGHELERLAPSDVRSGHTERPRNGHGGRPSRAAQRRAFA